MNAQDIQSLIIGYCLVCSGIFVFALWTCYEDTLIMRNSGEPEYPSVFTWDTEHGLILGAMFITSFVPLVNIVMFVNTILYRKGLL